MDHLPNVVHSCVAPLNIPYLVIEDYDRKGWIDFPSRRGWRLVQDDETLIYQLVREDSTSQVTAGGLASFLQTWLFFGTLDQIFGISGLEIDTDNFITLGKDGESILTTSKLPDYITSWKAIEMSNEAKTRSMHLRDVAMCLEKLSTWTSKNTLFVGPFASAEDVIAKVSLSILILAESLDFAKDSIWKSTNGLNPSTTKFPINGLTSLLMVERGWCPSEIGMFHEVYCNSTLYFVSLISRIEYKHENCSANDCVAHRQDPSEGQFLPKHTTYGCSCGLVKPDPAQLSAIIARGKLAKLLITDTSNGNDLVLEYVEDGPYVAISHVWQDGLGNPIDNSLPKCQLLRLNALASAVHNEAGIAAEKIPIWIDTICLPLGKPMKKQALRTMRKIFEDADEVLVLDADLQKISSPSGIEEFLLQIACCRWMRRLWTLEEGSVARHKLHFQFMGGPIELSAILQSAASQLEDDTWNNQHIMLDAMSALFDFLPDTPKLDTKNQAQALAIYALALQYRTSYKQKHEFICLASLLNLNTELVANTLIEHRKSVFYSLLTKAPGDIILSCGIKLQTPGYQWAPASFMTRNARFYHTLSRSKDRLDCVVDSSGLHCKFPGFLLTNNDEVTQEMASLRQCNQSQRVLLQLKVSNQSSPSLPTVQYKSQQVNNDLAVIQSYDFPQLGALVELNNMCDKVLEVNFLRVVDLLCFKRRKKEIREIDTNLQGIVGINISGKRLPDDQEWLVR